MGKNNGIGIELEGWNMTQTQIENAVLNAGAQFENNSHTSRGPTYWDGVTWQTMYDGSLSKPNNFELVSPVIQNGAQKKIAVKVINQMLRAGASTAKEAGLHITIGTGNSRWQKLGAKKLEAVIRRLHVTYDHFWEVIGMFMAASRRTDGNGWAARPSASRAWRNDDFNPITNGGGKYYAINMSKFASSQCIEFRHHGSSFNSEKIMSWITICQKLIAFSLNEEHKNKEATDFPKTIDGLADCLELTQKHRQYLIGRMRQLGFGRSTIMH